MSIVWCDYLPTRLKDIEMLCDSTGNVALRAGVSRTHPLPAKSC